MLDPPGDAPPLRRADLCPLSWGILEPRLGRETHRLGQRLHLLVSGVLYAALAEVGNVEALHDAARGLVELLARPPAPVRPPIGIKEEFEPLRYVQSCRPRLSLRVCTIQDTKPRRVLHM